MVTRYPTRMKKTSSMGQFTQQKTLNGDQQSKTLLAYSDVHIPYQQLISGSIQKKEYYTPTPNRMKAFGRQILPRLNVASNGDPSSNSISISLESSEAPQKRFTTNQPNNKNQGKIEVKNIYYRMQRKNSIYKESQKDQYSSNPQIYEDQINQSRKSYRKNYHKRLNIIPFRKCQSLIEERIVNVINKMESGKQCEKELRSLNQKLRKLPMRELMNRFVVSGVHTVRKLTEKQQLKQKISTDFSQLFQQTSKLMEHRILQELDNIQSFQNLNQQVQNSSYLDVKIEKSIIVRKAYKILKKKKKKSEKQKIRNQCLKMTENFFQYSPLNILSLIEAFNEKKIQK